MRVVTKQTLIATIAERFREANQVRGEWLPAAYNGNAPAIYAQLSALPPKATEADIIAITGDNRWTENICAECGEDSEVTVYLGEEPHHAANMTAICLSCLKQAKRLAEASS
jgi:hypothetical protein